MWIQKSRVQWHLKGDKNTKFFHLVAKSRERRNSINSVIINNQIVNDPQQVKFEVFNYFQNLFTESWEVRPFFSTNRGNTIDEGMSEILISTFSEEEIWNAIRNCDGNKSPGPDGFNLASIKKGWAFMKNDILKFMEEFHTNCNLPIGINTSFITLIPKCDSPVKLSNYRPISLIGCMYKILSKVLATRLKPTLNSVIGEVQSAFTGGRNIQDSILIANEIVDGWKRRKTKGLIIKLDLEKAFDNINWVFLFRMMRMMGYPDKWIIWIHECLSSARISVLVNGSPTRRFQMQKGIRQGDPLSPFLFILAAESLNHLFLEAVAQGSIKGLNLYDNGPLLTHLQFADDTLIFCGADSNDIIGIKNLLKAFEVMSGLKVNYHKTVVCGVGVDQSHLESFASILDCKTQSLPISYLGLPLGANPKLKSTWSPVIEKFQSRLSSWKHRSLSFGGRLTLVKSVLSSLPIYYLSLFKMPEGVAKKIEGIQSRFLWGSCDLKRKIHMVSWEKIKQTKEVGGLGVKGIREMNDALLIKWWWRFGSEKNALWRKIICSKYKMNPNSWLPNMEINRNVSMVWKDIMQIQNRNPLVFSKFIDNIRISIGNGEDTQFWNDPWVNGKALCYLYPRIFSIIVNKNESVAEVYQRKEELLSWQFQFRRSIFIWENEELDRMLLLLDGLHINIQVSSDHLIWNSCNSKSYSVSSMYNLSLIPISNYDIEERKSFKWLWKNTAPFRVQCFSWMVMLGKLKTGDFLLNIGVIQNPNLVLCKFCGESVESINHSLLLCSPIWNLWCKILMWWGILWVTPLNVEALFLWWRNTKLNPKIRLIWNCIPCATLWSIWKLRNEHIFQDKDICWEELVDLIKIRVAFWVKSKGNHDGYSVNDFIFNLKSIIEAS